LFCFVFFAASENEDELEERDHDLDYDDTLMPGMLCVFIFFPNKLLNYKLKLFYNKKFRHYFSNKKSKFRLFYLHKFFFFSFFLKQNLFYH